jgi:hypothetical protein
MTGSSIDFVVIPIVSTICLAAWLISVYYAARPPRSRITRISDAGDRAPRAS